MRTVLFRWCGDPGPYAEALTRVGAAPVRVVGRSEAPVERAPSFVAELASLDPALIVVAGWARLLRAELFELPRLGALNVHPSLLPSYRGRHPVFWALLRGEKRVGVTIHRMTERPDDGPILAQRALDVPARATCAELEARLDALGVELVAELVGAAARTGALAPSERELEAVVPSSFPPVSPDDGLIDWFRSATEIDRRVRACVGCVEAVALYRGIEFVVLDAEAEPSRGGPSRAPGTVLSIGETIDVATGDGVVALRRAAFLRRVLDAPALAAALSLREGECFAQRQPGQRIG